MSEFSIEEKANAYDLALNKAKTLLSKCKCDRDRTTIIYRAEDIESIFPELKEFSDEEIKKWLIGYFQEYKSTGIEKFANGLKIDTIIDWFKKQSESNPYSGVSFKYNDHTWGMCARDNGVEILLDGKIKQRVFLDKIQAVREMVNNDKKVEPKFKVGDFVINDYCKGKIIELTDDAYLLDTGQGIPFSCEHNIHLWTIEDAKDGDVLCVNNEVFIYAHKKQMYSIAVAHCFVDSAGGFYLGGEFVYREYGKTICPATKEQRDLLFKEIKKAGYKWNKNKKELKRL